MCKLKFCIEFGSFVSMVKSSHISSRYWLDLSKSLRSAMGEALSARNAPSLFALCNVAEQVLTLAADAGDQEEISALSDALDVAWSADDVLLMKTNLVKTFVCLEKIGTEEM
jgi:hypothetical protein